MFKTWQLAMIDKAGYNGITNEHIERVVNSILSEKIYDIDYNTFARHCHMCGIDPANFSQEDLDMLQEKLNEYSGF